ncbi:MAG: hypothetical protein ACXADL_16915 [Candidatus Thorarchaeota archaeon]
MQRSRHVLQVFKCAIFWAAAYVLFSFHPKPQIAVSFLVFGVVPAWPVITTAGAYGKSSVGFLTGFLGTIAFDLITTGTVLIYLLPAIAYGIMGLITGFAKYDFTNAYSLLKLALMSMLGMIFSAILIVGIESTTLAYTTLTDFVNGLFPLLTIGIPSVFVLTPIYAVVWYYISRRITTYRQFRSS